MTITTLSAPSFADFQMGAGRPSRARILSQAEHLDNETSLVETLRFYTNGLARHCQNDTPSEYAAFVNDLIEVDPDDAPSAATARLVSLLHIYADYMPSVECDYIDYSPWQYHGWQSPAGFVVVDVVTTLTMSELNPGGDLHRVESDALAATSFWGDRFAGVRYIVLDAPYESTWYPSSGLPMPLQFADINPRLENAHLDGGDVR
ncbi:hypothetical protein [Microbacterium sp.]|uniref:hypothetical protein n=1 Tax=Microbacterium sp. TaxID=51671 RepID=UPI00273418D7|nr:hypothetical protein [Microbacterium sp.]MDP3950818.1 hypothetical protein [Microbacterium sp.]